MNYQIKKNLIFQNSKEKKFKKDQQLKFRSIATLLIG